MIRVKGVFVTGILSACFVGCGSTNDGASGAEPTASVEIALSTVPSGVQCVKVSATVAGQTITAPLMSVATGSSSASLSLGQLPAGSATFAGAAYNVACASVTASTTANWVADSAAASLSPGTVTTVNMVFRPNNPVSVNASFVGNVAELTVGSNATYARMSDGTVYQWGVYGYWGTSPSLVPGLTNVVQVAAGSISACARKQDGTVWCWGDNYNNVLGPNGGASGNLVNTPVQVPIPGSMPTVGIYAGYNDMCAVAYNDTVYCWGDNSSYQLASTTPTSNPNPVGIFTGMPVAVGAYHICAVYTGSGGVYCWGNNAYGQLGNNSTTNSSSVVSIALNDVVDIAAGWYHTCALRGDGTVRCWGYNGYGNLGDGTTTNRAVPTLVSGITDAVQVEISGYTTCVRRSNGTVSCWGQGLLLGDGVGDNRSTPGAVPGLSNVTGIRGSAGASHFCAELADHTLKCWGGNSNNQLGDGTGIFAAKPVDVKL